jgi:hypothetical protein
MAMGGRVTMRKVVYVLTSTEADQYTNMAQISASLTRRLMPGVITVLLVDEVTSDSLHRRESRLLKTFDQVVPVETGITDPWARNRFVKTAQRQIVRGSYVYLDIDALPIRPFEEMFNCGQSLAAVADVSARNRTHEWTPFAVDSIRACGWEAPLPFQYNSGVLYMPDTRAVREFGRLWHQRWRTAWETTGDHRDQATFNSALHASGLEVRELPAAYNAYVTLSPWRGRNARILHFWVSGLDDLRPERNLLCHLLDVYDREGRIDWDAVRKARRNPLAFHPLKESLVTLLGPKHTGPRRWLRRFGRTWSSRIRRNIRRVRRLLRL